MALLEINKKLKTFLKSVTILLRLEAVIGAWEEGD